MKVVTVNVEFSSPVEALGVLHALQANLGVEQELVTAATRRLSDQQAQWMAFSSTAHHLGLPRPITAAVAEADAACARRGAALRQCQPAVDAEYGALAILIAVMRQQAVVAETAAAAGGAAKDGSFYRAAA
jgi:hypothetical protein